MVAAVLAGRLVLPHEDRTGPAGCMPPIPRRHQAFGSALCETTAEGTPVSTVPGTLEELAGWCEGSAHLVAASKVVPQAAAQVIPEGTLAGDRFPAFVTR